MQKTIDNHSRLAALTLLFLCAAAMLHAQSFPSGSTGADGALSITNPGVTTFSTPPVGGGSVYNFTTINIAGGSTLKLSGAVFAGPLYFLAQGAVTIAGTIDLSGQSGAQVSNSAQIPTIPGPGGYGGGAGSFSTNSAQPGLGPAGGIVGSGGCSQGQNGGITANQFLVPLVGGSGGGGGFTESGGAGGGALLIASSVSITVSGTITANGGNSTNIGTAVAGAGAGGSVRLVAPTIAGNGSITASAGSNNSCGSGIGGIVRLEFFQSTYTGSVTGTEYVATPVNLFLPTSATQPSIMVTSIGGVAVPPNPTGTFTVPDVALNSSSPLTVSIQGTNIPAGTTATVYFSTQNFPSQKIVSTPLAATGTPGITTATATVTLNPGWSLGYVIATWTQ